MKKSTNTMSAAVASVALAGALLAGAAGCGSKASGAPTDSGAGGSGGTGGGTGNGGTTGNGVISWQDNGISYDSLVATASLVAASGGQVVHVAGHEAGGINIGFDFSRTPTIDLEVYRCGATGDDPLASFSYTAAGVDVVFAECMVSLTFFDASSAGRVSGSFAAVPNQPDGGTRGVTGAFNVPLTILH